MTTPNEPPPDAPRVLLFGHAGAGKSSLLGALARAGEIQGETLRGEVQEATGRLATIRDAVYKGAPLDRTDTELTSYVVRLRPWRVGTQAVTEPATVVLHDCSGKAAESLIRHPSTLRDADTKAPVARAVIDADAIILLVDATSDDEQLHEAFEEFDTFLTVVAQGKANAREVGGFPIHLVLTKCDELAEPNDTRAQWEERVRNRAERAWHQFDAFLKDADPHDDIPSPFLPFGSIDLTVYAVAIRQPKLADSPPTAVPYQVAELFRDCFAGARTHRQRVLASNRQLKWTVRSALGLVAVMLIGALTVVAFPPQRGDPELAERVSGYRLHEPEAAVRLTNANLTKNKAILTGFRDDRAFAALPEDLREFVTSRLKEIEDYEAYRAKLYMAIAPGDTRTLDDLARIEHTLHTDLALPHVTWAETPAGELRAKWLADVTAIRATEETFLDRYRDFVRRGTVLTLTPGFGGNWRADVATLIAEAARPPALLDQALPGSPSLTTPRGQAVTNRVPYEFERVYLARRDWDFSRGRLSHLRDLADALGLTAGENLPEPLLVLPDPGPGVDSTTLPYSRWSALLRAYPQASDDFREWDLSNFPDPGRGILADRLDRSFRTGARHVGSLLSRVNATTKDTPEGWRTVADALGGQEFQDWGRLLHLLVRLRDANAPNPITELAAFLREPNFDIDLKGFELVVPQDLSLERINPRGPYTFTLTMTPKNGPPVTRKYTASVGTQSGSVVKFGFSADGESRFTYPTGAELVAETSIRAGDQTLTIRWDSGGSQAFQFERLTREPRVVRGNRTEPATGVRLTPANGSALPKVPALFQELRK